MAWHHEQATLRPGERASLSEALGVILAVFDSSDATLKANPVGLDLDIGDLIPDITPDLEPVAAMSLRNALESARQDVSSLDSSLLIADGGAPEKWDVNVVVSSPNLPSRLAVGLGRLGSSPPRVSLAAVGAPRAVITPDDSTSEGPPRHDPARYGRSDVAFFAPEPRRRVSLAWVAVVCSIAVAIGLVALQSRRAPAASAAGAGSTVSGSPVTSATLPSTSAQPAATATSVKPILKGPATPQPAMRPVSVPQHDAKPLPVGQVTVAPTKQAAPASSNPPAALRREATQASVPPRPHVLPPVEAPTKKVEGAAVPTPPAHQVAPGRQVTIPSVAPKPAAVSLTRKKWAIRPAQTATKLRPAVKPKVTAGKPKAMAKSVVPDSALRQLTPDVSQGAPPTPTGLPNDLTREEYGNQYFNHKLFDVWAQSSARLAYATWADIPDLVQLLDASTFRARVYESAGEAAR